MQPGTVQNFDVTVIGGGMAGMAASLHLAKAGFRVVCIEPETGVRQAVGESLDWSTPALLRTLGLPWEELIHSGIATYKRGVTLQLSEREAVEFRPPHWVGQSPFNVQLHTLHVDRMRLDRKLQDLAAAQGVTIVHDKALAVERTGLRILSIETASGARFGSPWFIDASGSSTSFLAREFNLPAVAYGPRKVCLWSYFTAPQAHEGTTIYMDHVLGEYQDWIWEIPIGPNTLSVGCVTTGERVKKWRDQDLAVADIFSLQLARFPRLAALSRAWRCRGSQGNVVQLPNLSGSYRSELAHRGRGRRDGRSHHVKRRNLRPEARAGGVSPDRCVAREIRVAIQGQKVV